MLWGIFFFIVLVWLESRFPDDGYRDDQDGKYYFFDEFIDKEDKNDKSN